MRIVSFGYGPEHTWRAPQSKYSRKELEVGRDETSAATERALHRSAAKAAIPPFGDAPDLAWRTPDATKLGTSVDIDNSVASRRSAGFSPRAAATMATPQKAAHAERVKSLERVTSLDPALVDRLADDVIRRVERHVRIERERRGL